MLSTIAVAKPSHIAQIQKIQVYIDMEASGPDNITINGNFKNNYKTKNDIH